MRCPNKTGDEIERLRAVVEYGLDHERVSELDPVIHIAARMFDCPAAAVNIIGEESVFLASSDGFDDDYERSRDYSFCAHAINQNDVMVVEDAKLDVRFHDNPIVESGAIRFYAGIPLRTLSGHALGALCVIDTKPHARFSVEDRRRLRELAGFVQDKLELRRLQISAASRSKSESGVAEQPHGILRLDAAARVVAWNEAAAAMFGYTDREIVGQSMDRLVADKDRVILHEGIDHVLGGGAPRVEGTEVTGVRSNGEHFSAELRWSRWFDADEVHFGVLVHDLTERLKDRDVLYHLANYDALTGLPNRNLLQQHMADSMAESQQLALIVTDLDGFTDINNTLGHAAGDGVLRLIATRIREVISEQGTVFRIGGGKFATLVLGGSDPVRISGIAREINAAITRPIEVDGHEIMIAGNCGIALAPAHGTDVDELMSSAELALFQSRGLGRGGAFLFVPALRAEAVARRMYDAELHRALERNEFLLFYQPQVRLSDRTVVSAEALIRWKHPVRGVLAPAAFLPALEAGVLADATGRWVLETACAQAKSWRVTNPKFRMSVNLFAAQFRSGELPAIVLDMLMAYQLPADALELEITENIILDQQESVLMQLKQLRQAGVGLSFDDFGTGFASLNLLRDYPVTHIKIDKSFTQVVQTSQKDRAIITSLIGLARQLDLRVVAEGVETGVDADFLRSLGCEKGQGYYFGKPVPAPLFADQFLNQDLAVLAG